MRITDEALKEFEVLWCRDHPNEEITKEQLRDMATRVMRAVSLVYQPIPSEKLDTFCDLEKTCEDPKPKSSADA